MVNPATSFPNGGVQLSPILYAVTLARPKTLRIRTRRLLYVVYIAVVELPRSTGANRSAKLFMRRWSLAGRRVLS